MIFKPEIAGTTQPGGGGYNGPDCPIRPNNRHSVIPYTEMCHK